MGEDIEMRCRLCPLPHLTCPNVLDPRTVARDESQAHSRPAGPGSCECAEGRLATTRGDVIDTRRRNEEEGDWRMAAVAEGNAAGQDRGHDCEKAEGFVVVSTSAHVDIS